MKIAILLFPLFTMPVWSQTTDDFGDGDFTTNPAWTGSTTDFTVNASLEVQTQNTVASTSYLATGQTFNPSASYEWQVRIKIGTAPSSGNFARFFLTSGTADLASDGFFLQFGEAGSTDAIRLKKIAAGIETEICSGPAGQIAASFNMRVRVLRSATGDWNVFADASGGTNFTLLATGSDVTTFSSGFLGFSATYTAGNASKYYFDDVYAGPEIIDSNPPELLSVSATSNTSVDVLFSEPVGGSPVSAATNYLVSPSTGVSSAVQDGANTALVHLTLSNALQNGVQYSLTVGSVQDNSGNTALNLQSSFTYLVNDSAVKGDLIISEFMCDPSPSVGLPELEYIEIYNNSFKYFNLSGWKLGDPSGNGTVSGEWIGPGEYKILCASSSQSFFAGSIAVSSFPSLNNSSDVIILSTPGSAVIDQLEYTDAWYHDESKSEGGYSIERINQADPCSDADNWRASESISGGTPGEQNSVHDNTPDAEAPWIVSAQATAPDSLVITFSEAMDSLAVMQSAFTSNPFLNVSAELIFSQGQHVVTYTFNEDLEPSKSYTFTISSVADCWNNISEVQGTFALAEKPQPGDLVINEILFDPGSGGSDFVEIYNRTSKVLNLENCYFATMEDGTISNLHTVTGNILLQPYGYKVFGNDTIWIKTQFPASVSGTFDQLSLPPLNNDSTTILIFNADSVRLDKVSYHSEWHLALIDDTEDKSLERISPDENSNSPDNWHTAAENIGFGTPGRINSQFQNAENNGEFGTVGDVFSPDNDGFQDVMQFYYTMNQPGMIATVSIYDSYGRIVRCLKKSELLGSSGNFNWDGVNESQQKAGVGIYIAVFEAFNKTGDANFSKRIAFTLAGKLD